MTTVRLHGILGKTFGTLFKLHLGRLNDVLIALDANIKNFRKKFNELINKGYTYTYYIFNNEIHVTPVIGGAGKTLIIIIAIILIVVAILLIAFVLGPLLVAANAAAAATAGTATAAGTTMAGLLSGGAFFASGIGWGLATAGFLTGMVLQQGIALLVQGLTMPEMPSPSGPASRHIGGSAASALSNGKSYIFGNTNNQAAQGIRIPIGYGRLRCSSKVIQVTVKNENTNFDFNKNYALPKNSLYD